jgi:hypothetical protein
MDIVVFFSIMCAVAAVGLFIAGTVNLFKTPKDRR